MKYKPLDKVRIKSLDWYNDNKDEYGYIDCGSRSFFTKMSDWCGKIATIKEICKTNCYRLEEYDFDWTDEMIEGLVEDETALNTWTGLKVELELSKSVIGVSNVESLRGERFMSGFVKAIIPPEGYQFVDENGNVINATKIVLEKKKKKYPKTYEECLKVLNIEGGRLCFNNSGITQYERDLYIMMNNLSKLLICRDAYWKIAGEEMGLGKPWEPDWKNSEERRYSIVNIEGDINLPEKTLTKWILKVTNKILVFPTEEVRDAFYENFKKEIEMCKELL